MFIKFTFLFFLAFNFLPFYSQALSQNSHSLLRKEHHLSESLVSDSQAPNNPDDFTILKSELETISSISQIMKNPIEKENSINSRTQSRILQNADDTISDGIDDDNDNDDDDDDHDLDSLDDTVDGDTADDIDDTFDDDTDDDPDDVDDVTDDNEVVSGGNPVQNPGSNNQNPGNNVQEEEPETNQEQNSGNQVPNEEVLVVEEEPEEVVEAVPIEGSVEENSDEEDPIESVAEENTEDEDAPEELEEEQDEEDSEVVIGGAPVEENPVEIIEGNLNEEEIEENESDGEETQEDVEESDEEDTGDETEDEEIPIEEVIPIEENLEEEILNEENSELVVGGIPIEENLEEDRDQDSDEEDPPTAIEEESDEEDSDEETVIGGGIPIEESLGEGEENSDIDDSTEDNLETIPIEEEEEFLLVSPEFDCSNPNNYHYPNRTCGSSCPTDKWIIEQDPQENYKMCTPCSTNCKTCQNTTETCTSCPFNIPYLNENSTCVVSCPSGTTIQESTQGQKLCVTPQLTPREQNFINFVDNSNAVTSTISSVTMVSYQLVNPGASAIPSVILLVNLLDYVKFLNISFPPKLDAMFDSQLTDYLSFQIPFDFPESLQYEIHAENVPWRFQRYEVNGLFLINMWGEILTAILVFAVAGIIALISFKVSNGKWFGKIIFWLQDFLIWNYVLVYWLSMLTL